MEDKLCKRCGSKLFRKDFTTKTVYYCERCFSCETTELECEHEYELMLFKLESGSTQLRKFCRKCKQRDPHPVKQTPENTSGLAIHDEVKYKQHMEGLRKTEDVEYRPFVEVFFEKQRNLVYEEYNEYLKTEHWIKLRNKITNRDGNICQICGDRSEVVHHLTYAHVRKEKDFELISLCQKCHWNEYHSPDAKKIENSILLPPNNE